MAFRTEQDAMDLAEWEIEHERTFGPAPDYYTEIGRIESQGMSTPHEEGRCGGFAANCQDCIEERLLYALSPITPEEIAAARGHGVS